MSGILQRLGKRHAEILVSWFPSLATYGVTGTLGLLYFTDWKAVIKYIPFYSGKLSEE
ncbi:cytochrome b-c1 complex subunit 10-like [Orussus abietinus]|uniref:cytochrome b-c1 complex subunit 10-like n=1 Tax=Orussus abietinus TaxID=222816 RepID=UPI000626AA1F|nr:cytochrome b-c1 complex subunit 10-like [Orussus abietinus]